MRRVKKRALVGHRLFKEGPSDFIEWNQHLCSREVLKEGASPYSSLPFQTKLLASGHFWDPWCFIFICPISCIFQFHMLDGHVCGWWWFYHLHILLPLEIGKIGLLHLQNLHRAIVFQVEKFLSWYMYLVFWKPKHHLNLTSFPFSVELRCSKRMRLLIRPHSSLWSLWFTGLPN